MERWREPGAAGTPTAGTAATGAPAAGPPNDASGIAAWSSGRSAFGPAADGAAARLPGEGDGSHRRPGGRDGAGGSDGGRPAAAARDAAPGLGAAAAAFVAAFAAIGAAGYLAGGGLGGIGLAGTGLVGTGLADSGPHGSFSGLAAACVLLALGGVAAALAFAAIRYRLHRAAAAIAGAEAAGAAARWTIERVTDELWELREREAQLAGVVAASGDVVVQRTANGRILAANAAFARLFGLEPDDVAGRSLFALLGGGPDEAAAGRDGDGDRPAGAVRSLPERDIPVATALGLRWISWTETRSAGDGEPVIRSIGRDVTDRKATEAALSIARDQAEAASAAKSRFLAMVSHEIRTPLNGILGMSNLLQQTALTAEQRTYAKAVETSGEALLLLIDDLLDFSKIEAGRLDLVPAATDVTALVEQLAELLAPRAHARGIELAAYIDPALPERLVLDPVRLRQVLFNLIGNGIKFTAEGGVAVEVLRRDGAAKGRVRVLFQVRDTGIGVDPADAERIFREFEQADPGPARAFGGTGLGLAISRRLVGLMGGDIRLDSAAGAGACFSFELDLEIEPGTEVVAPVPFVAAPAAGGARVTQDLLARALADGRLGTSGVPGDGTGDGTGDGAADDSAVAEGRLEPDAVPAAVDRPQGTVRTAAGPDGASTAGAAPDPAPGAEASARDAAALLAALGRHWNTGSPGGAAGAGDGLDPRRGFAIVPADGAAAPDGSGTTDSGQAGPAPGAADANRLAARDALAGRLVALVSHALIEGPLVLRRLFDRGADVLLLTQQELEAGLVGRPDVDVVLVDSGAGDPLALVERIGAVSAAPVGIMIDPRDRGELPALLAAGYGAFLVKPVRAASLVRTVLSLLGEAPFEAPAVADAPAPAEHRLPARRVLLCDDNEINALLGRGLIEKLGHHVVVAGDGRRAVALAEDALAGAAGAAAFDIVFMDLHMPEIDGFEAARRIRALEAGRGGRTPIVALTADLMPETRARGDADLFDGWLAKPLDPAALRDALSRLA